MEPYFFSSYAREDTSLVSYVIHILEERGVKIWIDQANLSAGENWNDIIRNALRHASGILLFVSKASMSSKWVNEEISLGMANKSAIIPIILEDIPTELMYPELISIHAFNLASYPTAFDGAKALAEQLKQRLKTQKLAVIDLQDEIIGNLAATAVEKARGGSSTLAPREQSGHPNSVFIVHGHDLNLLQEIESFIELLGIKSIVLSKISNEHQTLVQKFLAYGHESRFAIVLISADDLGVSCKQYYEPEIADRALQFRARQNVILELGFFYGYLGFENVFVLDKPSEKVFPNFERPSDLEGVLFDTVSDTSNWHVSLLERLRKADFALPEWANHQE